MFSPNILTCVSLTINTGDKLIGVHLTTADQPRLDKIVAKLKELFPNRGANCRIYLVGAIQNWKGYLTLDRFRAIADEILLFDTGEAVDVRAIKGDMNEVKFSYKPVNAGDEEYKDIRADKIAPPWFQDMVA